MTQSIYMFQKMWSLNFTFDTMTPLVRDIFKWNKEKFTQANLYERALNGYNSVPWYSSVEKFRQASGRTEQHKRKRSDWPITVHGFNLWLKHFS